MLTRVEIKGFKCLHDVSVELRALQCARRAQRLGEEQFLTGGEHAESAAARTALVPHGRAGLLDSTLVDIFGLRDRAFPRDLGRQAQGYKRRSQYPLDQTPRCRARRYAGSLRVTDPVMLEPTEIAAPSPRGTGTLSALIASRGKGATAHLARVALGDRERYEAIQKGMRDITAGRIRAEAE